MGEMRGVGKKEKEIGECEEGKARQGMEKGKGKGTN